ncbi:hypothetical protein EBT31_04010 [bacterium]|nr:hypothetical protein [bacterium]NBX49179.1 hypothetical protein [bacterium]
MAYPVVNAPYGLKPINLIGGQVFAGSTREYAIPYGYATNIFYGDIVGLTRGNVQRLSVSTGTLGTVTGVFLGCSYTNPTTKQKQFAQYWPASTLAGDAVAIVCDDPDTVFKAVVCSATTVVASGARAMIGQNLAMINNTGNVNTGDSANALLAPSDTPATTDALPVRVLGLVPDTVVTLGTATYTSISTATVTCSALPFALPVGTDVGSLAANGQYIPSGSFVDTAANAGATSFILNQAPITAFAASSTLVFAQYPELLVKLNFGQHQYYAATSIA